MSPLCPTEKRDVQTLMRYREKIIALLNLPQGTVCEYRSNKALLDAASKPQAENQESTSTPNRGYHHHNSNYNHHGNSNNNTCDRERDNHDRQHHHNNTTPHHGSRYNNRRDEEGKEVREPRTNGWSRPAA
jgi:translation initiation factor 4E